MYLFILESIGTQELVLIGIIALVVFGPRKLPEMARKLGSMMTEFRRVSSDFRSTWENAVALDEPDPPKKIGNTEPVPYDFNSEEREEKENEEKIVEKVREKTVLPEVRQMTGEEFEKLAAEKGKETSVRGGEKTEWL